MQKAYLNVKPLIQQILNEVKTALVIRVKVALTSQTCRDGVWIRSRKVSMYAEVHSKGHPQTSLD